MHIHCRKQTVRLTLRERRFETPNTTRTDEAGSQQWTTFLVLAETH